MKGNAGLRINVQRPLGFATGAICLATLLSYAGRWSWICELLVNFRTHFALLLSLALLISIALRHWRIAGVAVIGLALNVWPMHGAFFGSATPPVSNARAVRVVAFNVHIENDNMPGVAAYLESQAADVAVLEELSPANADQLAALLPQLPHRYFAEHEGVWGVAILSRWPLIAPQPATRDGLPFAARADVDLGDRKFRLYGAHLNWPVMPARSASATPSSRRSVASCGMPARLRRRRRFQHHAVVESLSRRAEESRRTRLRCRSRVAGHLAIGSARGAAHPHRSMPRGRSGECWRPSRRR